MPVSCALAGDPVWGSKSRRNVYTTSLDVSMAPLWNSTRRRILKVQTSALSLDCHDSASCGRGVKPSSMVTSRSYTRLVRAPSASWDPNAGSIVPDGPSASPDTTRTVFAGAAKSRGGYSPPSAAPAGSNLRNRRRFIRENHRLLMPSPPLEVLPFRTLPASAYRPVTPEARSPRFG